MQLTKICTNNYCSNTKLKFSIYCQRMYVTLRCTEVQSKRSIVRNETNLTAQLFSHIQTFQHVSNAKNYNSEQIPTQRVVYFVIDGFSRGRLTLYSRNEVAGASVAQLNSYIRFHRKLTIKLPQYFNYFFELCISVN